MFDKLRKMTGGDEHRLKIYANMFLEVMPEYIDQLERAIEDTNLEEIREAVHGCKYTLSSLGLDQTYMLADKIEFQIDEQGEKNEIISFSEILLKELKEAILKLKTDD